MFFCIVSYLATHPEYDIWRLVPKAGEADSTADYLTIYYNVCAYTLTG